MIPARRKAGGGAVALGCVGGIALGLAVTFVNAWILMLLWGAIVPVFVDAGSRWHTIGYGTSYLFCLGLAFVGGFFRGVGK